MKRKTQVRRAPLEECCDRIDQTVVPRRLRRILPSKVAGNDHRRELNRLNRIIGQLEGIRRMIEEQRELPPSPTARKIEDQLVRSAMSAGANYEEARGADSRPDFCNKQQISLKEMRESGLVERQTDPEDRRAVVISATTKGRQLMHKGRDRRVKKFADLIEGLSSSELETLSASAEILARLLSSGQT